MCDYFHVPVVSTAYHGTRTVVGAATIGHCGNPCKQGARTVQHAAQDVWLLASAVLLYAVCQTKQLQPHFRQAVTKLQNMNAYKQVTALVQGNRLATAAVNHLGDVVTLATATTRCVAITSAVFVAASVVTWGACHAAR